MTEKPDNPIRFKGKRIGIIATHGVEETEVSIKRRVSDRERNTRAGR
jgi:protease I